MIPLVGHRHFYVCPDVWVAGVEAVARWRLASLGLAAPSYRAPTAILSDSGTGAARFAAFAGRDVTCSFA